VVEVAEATSLGAAILGGLGTGVYADLPTALASLQYAQTPVEPLAGQVALYDAYFRQIYQQLYNTLRPLHRSIYELQDRQ
jgi:sugar (pentulose or hexulose) kinase